MAHGDIIGYALVSTERPTTVMGKIGVTLHEVTEDQVRKDPPRYKMVALVEIPTPEDGWL